MFNTLTFTSWISSLPSILGGDTSNASLVLDLIVLASLRNAPAVQACDFAVGVEGNKGKAVVAAAGPQNFVSDADVGFDFVRRLDGCDGFRIEEHSVCLLVMGGQGSSRRGMHPRRSIPPERQWDTRKKTHRRKKRKLGRASASCWRSTLRAAGQSVAHRRSSLFEKISVTGDSTLAPGKGCLPLLFGSGAENWRSSRH